MAYVKTRSQYEIALSREELEYIVYVMNEFPGDLEEQVGFDTAMTFDLYCNLSDALDD